jgi:hypothetical protein
MLPLDASANFTNVTVDASWSPDDLSSKWDPSFTSRSPTAANRPMGCRFARSSDDSGDLPAGFPAQMLRWRRRSGVSAGSLLASRTRNVLSLSPVEEGWERGVAAISGCYAGRLRMLLLFGPRAAAWAWDPEEVFFPSATVPRPSRPRS